MEHSGGRSVLEGAFSLLEALKTAGDAGLTTLASASGLPKATTHRLLEQLVQLGAVERSAGRYRMGPRMFRLGQAWQPHPKLLAVAREPIRQLSRATGTTVGVCVQSEGRTLVAAAVPGDMDAVAPIRPGAICPSSTAAGKVLAATAGHQDLFGPLSAGWRREAAEIRDRGAAFDHEELISGVCCVAVPIHGPTGEVIAALCVLTDPSRPITHLTQAAGRVARNISLRLNR
ncbi:IclR family transcriptional regulator [Actinoallomurus liliacearum]|uniref:IclR family transcriptional regulator n=1 Tax=Actinoallomurus liliacearum TaxID=1080073 RepID=A0ABP8TM80_9ACTN